MLFLSKNRTELNSPSDDTKHNDLVKRNSH